MKKLVLTALALLTMAGSGFAQNLPSYVPANGLVGWWPFNGNANDESGNGNNGTVNGATLSNDRFGNAGKAYSFVNDDITVPVSSSNFSGNYSISMWVRLNPGNGVWSTFLLGNDAASGNTNNNYLCFQYSGPLKKLNFYQPINNSAGVSLTQSDSAGIQNWTYVSIVNIGQLCKLYINGQLNAEASPIFNTYNGNFLHIGRGGIDNEFVNGQIDDIAIYNRALSQQEITALYQGGNTTANCLDLPSNLQQGLIGYWPFCGNANDESGNGNHGTVNGATLSNDRFGNAGKAYSFVNDDITVPVSSSNFLGNYSISMWVRLNPGNGVWSTFLLGNDAASGNTNNNYLCFQYSGPLKKLNFYQPINNSAGVGLTQSDSAGIQNWTYVSIVKIGQLCKLFINGQLNAEASPIFNSNNGNFLHIGRRGINNEAVNGQIDDIAIWNRALSQEEITQLYNQGICKTSITVTDTLLIHTGITAYNPVAYQNTLKVWPNPGNQDITLDAGNLASMQGWKIKISNSLGQEVYPATIISQQQQVLDLSNWGGNGLYLLHLINPQGHITEVKKIVLAP